MLDINVNNKRYLLTWKKIITIQDFWLLDIGKTKIDQRK